ncbi:hypothetical protein S7711_11368 [Stachybotrys chartarum IBT 7711]|uniref:Uncharacterized protein n=1 Tax=Stachybotrys chartarum (strain CBS 109288 / IBT 7711) TaxID=1280523 RepID=A0A084ALR3_STACB|nr:hypothetical protein S7711_11368 [Stachybotrys chartarum IBT 7711]
MLLGARRHGHGDDGNPRLLEELLPAASETRDWTPRLGDAGEGPGWPWYAWPAQAKNSNRGEWLKGEGFGIMSGGVTDLEFLIKGPVDIIS